MNNKGMTLVELIVAFSLLMIIVVGMFNLILDVKSDLDSKQVSRSFIEYSDTMNNTIHMDILKNRPVAIAIKKVPTGRWRCTYSNDYTAAEDCAIDQSTNVFQIEASKTIGDSTVNVSGSKNLSDVCSGFYPCAVYAYYDQNNTNTNITVSFKTIAINKDRSNNQGFGIKYGNTFEKIPNQKYVNFLNSKPTIKFESSFLIIDYPLYATGDNTNYGFKIAYPLYEARESELAEDEGTDSQGNEG